jgi:predicted enzyme related to lactoylglutathione lyase
MPVTGPDFISLQVRDLERSATFYEQHMGLSRSPKGPPHAVGEVVPGVDLDSVPRPGLGTALWLHATDAQDLHDTLAAAGTPITSAPVDGPFGRTFTFADPDGYLITIHDRA